MDDKQKIAQIDSEAPIGGLGAVIRYQLSDHLGSASLELDENADIISYEEYYPFGTTSYRNGRNEVDVSLKRYKYVMKELDNETGLYYYGMRYYASWICRFVSVDPLQHKYPELTPFQYSSNSPVTFIDLDGLEKSKTNVAKGGWVLEIYSPEISEKMYNAINEGNIIEQRRLSYGALNSKFPDKWSSSISTSAFHKLEKESAKLTYEADYEAGLTLILYGYYDKNNKFTTDEKKAERINVTDNIHFDFYTTKAPDKWFPVDVNLYTGRYEQSDGSNFYSEYDFEGWYGESSIYGDGSGLLYGRLKGYGFLEFHVETRGLAANVIPIEAGAVLGNYNGEGATPENPLGLYSSFIGYGFLNSATGNWHSNDNEFEGTSGGFSLEFGYSGGIHETKTSVLSEFTNSSKQKATITKFDSVR